MRLAGVGDGFFRATGAGLEYTIVLMETADARMLVAAGESPAAARPDAGATGAPWYCKALVFAALCILTGIVWDISWHSTIGRDTFWTAPHICIHFGGTLGGLVCGWLVLRATWFGTEAERASSVRLWGFRGPLGAWVTIWGALAMLTSAPFDNWWHDAYGLDVEILSPPHSVLAAGMYAHVLGGFLLVLGAQNRAAGHGSAAGRWLFVGAAGILLSMAAIMITEMSFPNLQRSGTFLRTSCLVYPLFLVPAARAARVPMPATTVASIYMLLMGAAVWILPLIPGTPKLGPIYNPVTHMVPPAFPLLMVAPALAIDLLFLLLKPGRRWWRDLILAVLVGAAFTAVFGVTQWFFAKFLLSPAADNWFFAGNRYWTYFTQMGSWRQDFWRLKEDPINGNAIFWSMLWAVLASYAGLLLGNWMTKVKR